ncbi:hypothetical protein [Rhizobium sp. AG855]|uniref:hypothetical protein n=1 Tax=Rhizobium sp. AG855 TaxID=2183898 RepID=UPI000E763B25|nr:hypothetical protein [Rhizobium sp. AG855]RKE83858.1 hypothetical protein DFO46_0616 [Rhizobium sp. AG855]
MVYSNSDWIQAIAKLTEWTSRGKVTWNSTEDYANEDSESVKKAFESVVGSNRYVVKEVSRQEFYDSGPSDFYWQGPYYSFEVYQKIHNSLEYTHIATAPTGLPVVRDLFKKVVSAFAFQNGALDELLKQDVFD